MIKGPVTKYLPGDSPRIGFEVDGRLVHMAKFAEAEVQDDKPPVFVVGAFSHGNIETAYVDTRISVSQFPLSAACALGRVTNALENKWGVV